MPTTFNWIYLGTEATARIDLNEGDGVSDNAGVLLNRVYGTGTDPLYNHIISATPIDNGGLSNQLDVDNNVVNDQFSTNIGGGTKTYVFDGYVQYIVTITYADGTTTDGEALVVQAESGELFLAPSIAVNSNTPKLAAKPIVSIKLNSYGLVSGGFATDRLLLGFDDGWIEGTAGNDSIDAGYVEPVEKGSDRVDGGDGISSAGTSWNDDRIRAGLGKDTVRAGLGNDTVHGGDGHDQLFGEGGNDLLQGDGGNDTLDGGAGTDTLTGGAGSDVFVADGTADLITDFGAGNSAGAIDDGDRTNNDFVDLSAFYNETTLAAWNAANPGNTYNTPLAWLRADQADGILQQAGGLRIQNGGTAVAGTELTEDTTGVTCFIRGTLIRTSLGKVAVEALEIGLHQVLTVDHGYRRIRWIGVRKLHADELAARPNLRPIRIRAGALARNCPEQDLVVSPQHRILVSSRMVRNITGDLTGLVAAKHLVGAPGIEIAEDLATVEYWHFLFDAHEVVWSNGAQTESLYTGKEALQAMGPEALDEIFAIFPELRDRDEGMRPAPARRLLNGREGREMTRRKIRKASAFVEAASPPNARSNHR